MCLHISSVWNDCSCGFKSKPQSEEWRATKSNIFSLYVKKKTIKTREKKKKKKTPKYVDFLDIKLRTDYSFLCLDLIELSSGKAFFISTMLDQILNLLFFLFKRQ
jgi:hypothetical protein